jgi:hypothetical protein
MALIVSAIAIGNAAYEAGNLLGATLGMRGVAGGPATLWVPSSPASRSRCCGAAATAIERVLVGMVVLMSWCSWRRRSCSRRRRRARRGLFVPAHRGDDRARCSSRSDSSARRSCRTTCSCTPPPCASAGAGRRPPCGAPRPRSPSSRRHHQHGHRRDGRRRAGRRRDQRVGDGRAARAAARPLGRVVLRRRPVRGRHDVRHHRAARRELRRRRRPRLAARPAQPRLRAVWGAVLLAGVPFAIAGTRPTIPLGFGEVSVIVFAQVANGILLPAIAVFLLLAVNDRRRMGAEPAPPHERPSRPKPRPAQSRAGPTQPARPWPAGSSPPAACPAVSGRQPGDNPPGTSSPVCLILRRFVHFETGHTVPAVGDGFAQVIVNPRVELQAVEWNDHCLQ